MKKGICYGAFPGNLSWKEKFQMAKDAGFDGIELPTITSADEARELKKIADDIGIAIPSVMDSLHWQCPLSSPDPAVRQKGMDNVRKSLEGAAIMGADTVLLVPGVVTAEVSYKDAYGRSLEGVRKLAEVAEEFKVFLAIENVWNKFLLSPLEMNTFIESVGSKYVAAYLDVGNLVLYGYAEHWIEVLGSKIKKVHAKNFDAGSRTFTYLLSGSVNWKAVMDGLRRVGYDDYVTAELPPYSVAPEQMIIDTSAHLDKIFAL